MTIPLTSLPSAWADFGSNSTVESTIELEAPGTRWIYRYSGFPFRTGYDLSLEKPEDHQYIVSDDLFGSYGVGETEEEALTDFLVALSESYEELEQDEDRLSDALKDRLQVLRHFLLPLS